MITVSMTWVRKLNEINNKIDQASGLYKKFFICGKYKQEKQFAAMAKGKIHAGQV